MPSRSRRPARRTPPKAPDGRPVWLPNPPDGTSICTGFDGSMNDDWTAIKAETREGRLFTPRYGPDQRPTIWIPSEWGGRIPRQQVRVAWAELAGRFKIRRSYCDPGFHDESDWTSDIEDWDEEHGPDVFVPWPTNQVTRMYHALRRFESDLENGLITHDGCPITATHVGNARKIPQKADRYILGKPSPTQKIDVAMTGVLAHEAAADERAAGWDEVDTTVFVFR